VRIKKPSAWLVAAPAPVEASDNLPRGRTADRIAALAARGEL
jgi:hypothetical protein